MDLGVWIANLPAMPEAPLMGLALLVAAACALAEVLHRAFGLPRVVGYGSTGLVFGSLGLAEVSSSLPLSGWTRLVFDLGLGVVLFELGGRVRLGWLRHNVWLLLQALAASAGTGIAVYAALGATGVADATALACALLALAGSPAVLMGVIGNGAASGQVTERALMLTAVGTLLAVIGARVLTGWLLHQQAPTDLGAVAATLYLLGGSALMAAVLALATTRIAARMDAGHENSMLMLLAVLSLAILAARSIGLSSVLVPLLAGLLVKQLSPRPWAWPKQFGAASAALVVLMFVLTTAAWDPALMAVAALPAAVMLGSRWAAAGTAMALLAWPSGATLRQALAGSLCLVPMCGTVLVIASDVAEAVPGEVLPGFVPIIVIAVAAAEVLGAVLAWAGLRLVGETQATD